MPKLVLKGGTRPPWVGLAAAVWVQIAGGSSYNFSLYSHLLKSVLGLNQQQLTVLGVANDIGESMGLVPGLACNRFPPWVILLFGAFCCFIGYGAIWLAVSRTVPNLPYWLLWLTHCIATNSNAWFGTAVLVTNMRNFPLSRGTVAGILKGYVGLSAAVYTVIYSLVLKKSALNLLLFLTIGIPILCLALMYFVRPCTPASTEDPSERAHFLFTQAACVLLGLFLVSTTILDATTTPSDAVGYTLVAIMVILLMSPLAVPIKMTICAKTKTVGPRVDSSEPLASGGSDSSQIEPLLTPSSSATNLGSFYENDDASDVETLLAVGEGAIHKKKRRPKRGEDFKLREAVIKADFWLLWFLYFLGVGPGITVLNNLSQIGISLGINDTTLLLALFSFCNFVGRLGSGVISEHFVRSRMIPRSLWMMFALVLMSIAFLLYASGLTITLYIATGLTGISYGVLYSMMVPLASEIFGLKNFGVIFNFMQLGNPIGAVLFSVLLTSTLYDKEAAMQGSITCIGQQCFRTTFFILSGVAGLGSIVSLILTIRLRPVYQMLYAGGSFRLPQSSGH
ncbi:protein NUCLEAR FUSION DEFECTIVE 4 [Cucumis melo var. makuwa]|uniref:Protein NUCLEAR FUSION DEFECTIVE 4 n=2 Tax=Cucumis melo TaxID=3656 RepID=A0A5D3E0Y7_CUCMM|nr:protein NUCLEAR FUSION DEFECTIVE 4 [Cucumis melo]TYK29592.1 protein NUCLEAR FUSION DEFECTIVE 4 [Cucumis melo var. makuwa]